jgi:hypothetical protein
MAVKNQPSTTPFGVDNGLYIFCQMNNAFTPTLQLRGLPGTATEQAAGQKKSTWPFAAAQPRYNPSWGFSATAVRILADRQSEPLTYREIDQIRLVPVLV